MALIWTCSSALANATGPVACSLPAAHRGIARCFYGPYPVPHMSNSKLRSKPLLSSGLGQAKGRSSLWAIVGHQSREGSLMTVIAIVRGWGLMSHSRYRAPRRRLSASKWKIQGQKRDHAVINKGLQAPWASLTGNGSRTGPGHPLSAGPRLAARSRSQHRCPAPLATDAGGSGKISMVSTTLTICLARSGASSNRMPIPATSPGISSWSINSASWKIINRMAVANARSEPRGKEPALLQGMETKANTWLQDNNLRRLWARAVAGGRGGLPPVLARAVFRHPVRGRSHGLGRDRD